MKTNLLKSIFISLILLVGATNAWAGEGFYGIYIKYNHNGTAKTSNGEWTNPLTLGTLTSDFKVTDVYLKVWWENWSPSMSAQLHYWKDGNEQWSGTFTNVKSTGGNNREVYVENWNKVLASTTETSGSHEITYKWEAYFSSVTHTLPSSGTKKITYTVAPPAVKSFTVTPSGDFISGSGEQDDPYIIKYNGSLTLTLSGSQNHTDANSTIQYNASGTWNTTPVKTINEVNSTTVKNVTVKARYTNKADADLSGTESSKTIYYRSEDVYSVTINNDGHGTTDPSGARSNVGQVTGLDIEAFPATNYEFVNWTITSGSGSFGSETSASTTFKPTSAATIQANFRSTATNFLNVEVGEGIASVTGSKDPVTLGNTYNITATPKTGYTFSTWTANPAENATFGSATTANTTVTVKNGSVIVTASATENMSTLTTSNSYTEGNPEYAAPTASVNSIGYETTATVTATTPSGAYTFTDWTLTNCERTDNGEATALTITVRSMGDGAAATVIANYEKIPPKTVYFRPKTDWKNNNPVIICDGNSTAVTPYDCAGEYYTAEVPGGTTNLKFGGDNEQTLPLTVPADEKVLYDMTSKTITKLYLKANSNWKADGARFAAYFFGNGEKWVSMTAVAGQTDLYEVAIPTDKSYPSVIFCRMNGGTQTNNWSNKWNQTADLSIPTDGTNRADLPTNVNDGANVTWHTEWDDSRWKEFTAPTYNITLYKTDGGTIAVSKSSGITLNEQVTVTMTADPGYSFQSGTITIGNQEEQTISTTESTHTICGPTTITATWKPDTHTVTFDANGHGTAPNEQSVDYNEKVEEPEAPTANGYTFGGWYTDAECTNAWTFNTDVVTEDLTLYAKWTATEYTITYNDLYGVTHSNPETYTIESETITFTAPTSTRTGYTFAGWDPTEIEKGSTDNKTVTAQWTINNYDITYTQPTNGSYTIKVGNGADVTTNTTADYNTTITLANNPATGYHFSQWNIEPNVSITNNTFLMPANDVTIGVTFAANTYKVKFDANGGTGTMSDLPFTYDIAQYLTANVFERTGYNFSGWNTNADGTGTTYTDGESVQNLTAENEGTVTLYAQWTAKTYTVTLQHSTIAGYGSGGISSVIATYDAAMPSATMPTAAAGYAFMGYFDGEQGAGTPYYDADGASARVWDKAEEATLYAHFAKAEITQITLDKYTFEPVEAGGTGFVTATPTIEPTPTNDVVLCWRLLYNNGNPVAGRDAQVVSGNSVQFSIAGLAAGTYKIEAVLRTGNNCGSGEVLSTQTVNFSIASSYTITVRYTCDGKEIATPAKVSASVTEETEITAPNITGYTFSSWEAGDGVTIKSTNNDKVKITAIYDGYLTAKYTVRPMVYFKNTLGWEKVYVYTFWDNAWWNDSGTGVHPATNKLEQGEMTLIEGTTDIYYFELSNPDGDYTQDNNANRNYIAFSNKDMSTYDAFYDAEAIYRGDHKNNLTLFIPQADQNPSTTNQTKYYNKGIWMKYNSTESGYQMPTNNSVNDNPPGLGTDDGQGWSTSGNKFTAQTPGGYKFSITKHLEANKTYEFKIKNYVYVKDWEDKDNNEWYGYNENSNTITDSKCTELHFHEESDKKHDCGNAKIKTTAEGEYTFTIDLSQGKVLLSVEYPIEVGDYRVIYKDNATWSKGTAHDANWYHPSRIIKKNKTAEPTKDIISFFISYGQNTTMQFQRVKSITTGKVTWEDAGEARIPDAVKEAGVYNFIVTQAENGASISMEDSAEPYTGNYYIRVDALAGKWDNYKTNPENRMTYSAFSESEANSFGEKFSHYATKYCTNGTNIKFTIANDYSPCISDTLVQDVVNPLGNLDSEGTLLSNDMYNANVRFMWYRKTNKISRAYVGPAGDKQSQFLMLRTNVEMQDAAGDLDEAEGDIIDAGNSIYAARFADTQNWIYERTVKVKPGTRVKLYASYPKCYHIYVENNTGWSDIALYAWKDGGDEPLGDWPGLRPARTVEIDGTTYHDFQVNEWVFGSKLILNNNNNSQQTPDYINGIETAGNYYLTATSGGLTENDYKAITPEANAQYFRGAYADNDWSNENTVEILGGSTGDWQTIRVIYDFKTNRLMRAWVPSGDITGEQAINADLMIIREHQEDATCITFANNSSKLSEVKTVYGTLQFNRWVLNNRNSKKAGLEYCTREDNNQKVYDEGVVNTHHPVLSTGEQKSIYERALYFISFPFDVHLSDVFGFGEYGTHWVISTYNGLRRAQRGYFAENCFNDDCTNWDYIWDPSDFKLEANKGYLLSLDLELMRYDNTDFWIHNIDQVELFFPSTVNLATIEKTSYTMSALDEEYLCKINHNTDGTTPDRDRRVKDSYWRCIGVPSFANYDGSLYKSKEDAEANEGEGKYPINWKDDYTWTADESGFPFLYEWNVTDNSLSVQSTNSYTFKSTFAYLVQNGKSIYWSVVNAKPSPIVARQRSAEQEKNYEWKITLSRNDNQEDQTFLRMTDNEEVTEDFDFNQDLAKELNYGRSDIYTLIGYERAAANSMPFSENTTVVPLGLDIEQAGDYTIAMPEGVESVGVTLLDVETGTRTNLSAGMNYTVALNKGVCHNRLYLEISPVQNDAPTDIEYTDQSTREENIRKVLIDGKLYIVCDGVVYDAQGHVVQ